MKIFVGLALVVLAVSGIGALPARDPSDDAEVINVPRRGGSSSSSSSDGVSDFPDFKGVIDTGSGYPFLQPSPHAFSFNLGFFDSFEDIFRRLRTRLWSLGDDDSDSTELGVPRLNPKKGNTTSTVKIINGHKVVVNETVYGGDDNIYKVRVISVHPVGSDEQEDDDALAGTGGGNPVTTAPPKRKNTELDADDDEDDEDSRREPLADKTDDNEIRGGNIDDREVKI